MKKLTSLLLVALLALGANVSAQEATSTGATSGAAAGSTIGGIATTTVAIGVVAVGVAAAVIANQNDDDRGLVCDPSEIIVNGQCACPAGQSKVNGQCVPETQLVCEDPRGGELQDGICVIPANTIVDTNGITITNTITYLPVER